MKERVYQVYFHNISFSFAAVYWPFKQKSSRPSYSLNGNVYTC